MRKMTLKDIREASQCGQTHFTLTVPNLVDLLTEFAMHPVIEEINNLTDDDVVEFDAVIDRLVESMKDAE
jgi:hypothetical protein